MKTQENLSPWKISFGKIIAANGITICTLPSRKSNDSANLICAAPDMRDALQAIVDAFGDQDSLLIDQCKAAIAKSIGKQ